MPSQLFKPDDSLDFDSVLESSKAKFDDGGALNFDAVPDVPDVKPRFSDDGALDFSEVKFEPKPVETPPEKIFTDTNRLTASSLEPLPVAPELSNAQAAPRFEIPSPETNIPVRPPDPEQIPTHALSLSTESFPLNITDSLDNSAASQIFKKPTDQDIQAARDARVPTKSEIKDLQAKIENLSPSKLEDREAVQAEYDRLGALSRSVKRKQELAEQNKDKDLEAIARLPVNDNGTMREPTEDEVQTFLSANDSSLTEEEQKAIDDGEFNPGQIYSAKVSKKNSLGNTDDTLAALTDRYYRLASAEKSFVGGLQKATAGEGGFYKAAPFLGGMEESMDILERNRVLDKALAGDKLTKPEKVLIEAMGLAGRRSGVTPSFGEGVSEIAAGSLPYALEFAITDGTYQIPKQLMAKYALKTAPKLVNKVASSLVGVATQSAVQSAPRVQAEYLSRISPDWKDNGSNGITISKNENTEGALGNAILSSLMSNISERSGGLIPEGMVAKLAGIGWLKKKFPKLVYGTKAFDEAFDKFAQKTAFDGVPQEIFEEYVDNGLQSLYSTNQDQKKNIAPFLASGDTKGAAKAFWGSLPFDQTAQMAVSFALVPLSKRVLSYSTYKLMSGGKKEESKEDPSLITVQDNMDLKKQIYELQQIGDKRTHEQESELKGLNKKLDESEAGELNTVGKEIGTLQELQSRDEITPEQEKRLINLRKYQSYLEYWRGEKAPGKRADRLSELTLKTDLTPEEQAEKAGLEDIVKRETVGDKAKQWALTVGADPVSAQMFYQAAYDGDDDSVNKILDKIIGDNKTRIARRAERGEAINGDLVESVFNQGYQVEKYLSGLGYAKGDDGFWRKPGAKTLQERLQEKKDAPPPEQPQAPAGAKGDKQNWESSIIMGVPARQYITEIATTAELKSSSESGVVDPQMKVAIDEELARREKGEHPLVVARREGSVKPIDAGDGQVYLFRQASQEEADKINAGSDSGVFWTTDPKAYLPREGQVTLVAKSGDVNKNYRKYFNDEANGHFQETLPRNQSEIVDVIDRAGKSIKPPTAETGAKVDWELFNENLRGDLDSFSSARDTGKVNYDLADVADRFVEFAKQDTSGKSPHELVSDFAKTDEASKSQISKLRQSVKNITKTEAPTPAAKNQETNKQHFDNLLRDTFGVINRLPADNIVRKGAEIGTRVAMGAKTDEEKILATKELAKYAQDAASELRKISPKDSEYADRLEKSLDDYIKSQPKTAEPVETIESLKEEIASMENRLETVYLPKGSKSDITNYRSQIEGKRRKLAELEKANAEPKPATSKYRVQIFESGTWRTLALIDQTPKDESHAQAIANHYSKETGNKYRAQANSGSGWETIKPAEPKPFSPDEDLLMHSPHTGEDSIVNFRGYMPDGKAMVWTGKMQMAIPAEWLRRKGEAKPITEKPVEQTEKPLPSIAIQKSITQILKSVAIIEGKINKKAYESAYASIRLHANKLGIEIEPLGTYFNADQYKRVASHVQIEIGKKFGSFPTAEHRAKRDAVLAADAARKAAKKPNPLEQPPAPDVPKFKRGDKISVQLQKGGREYDAVAIQMQPDGSGQVKIVGEKDYRTVKAWQVLERKSARTRKAKTDEIKDYPPEQRKQIADNAKEFRKIVEQHAPELGWGSGEIYAKVTNTKAEGMANQELRNRAVQHALDAVNGTPGLFGSGGQENSLLDLHNNLQKLKDLIYHIQQQREENRNKAEQTTNKGFADAADNPRPDSEHVGVSQFNIGTKFKYKGEDFVVTGITPDGVVTVQDGRKFGEKELRDDQQLYIDKGTLEKTPEDTGFDTGEETPPAKPEQGQVTPEQIKIALSSDEAVKILDDAFGGGNSPMFGGCLVCAKAILKLHPEGQLVAFIDDRRILFKPNDKDTREFNRMLANGTVMVEHYAVKIGEDRYLDAQGESSFEGIKDWFIKAGAYSAKYFTVIPATEKLISKNKQIQTNSEAEDKMARLIRSASKTNPAQPKAEPKSGEKIFTDTEADEAEKWLRENLGLNEDEEGDGWDASEDPGHQEGSKGLDPKILARVVTMAGRIIESGNVKFSDYAAQMLKKGFKGDLAKYIPAAYHEVRDFSEASALRHQMSTREEVDRFDYNAETGQFDESQPDLGGTINSDEPGAKRPPLREVDPSLIPTPTVYVKKGQYTGKGGHSIDEQQRFAINVMLTAKANGEKAGVLADGTGVGKTGIELVLAVQLAEMTGKPVAIVTENKAVIENRVLMDAKKFGIEIDFDKVRFFTYTDLSSNNLPDIEWGAVIFDESQNIKNIMSSRGVTAENIKSEFNVYGTATPMDNVFHAPYFLGKILGVDVFTMARRLGYELVSIDLPNGKSSFMAKWLKSKDGAIPISESIKRLKDYRSQAVKRGTYIRREYPFFGTANFKNVPSYNEKQLHEQDEINNYWDALAAAEPKKAMVYKAQRMNELARWTEAQKVQGAIGEIVADYEAGKHVVVFAEYVNDGVIKGLEKLGVPYEVPGTLKYIAAELKKRGIPFATVFGRGKNKGKEAAEFQRNKKIRVLLATPKSGGAGLDMDDTHGDFPRIVHMLTMNYSASIFDQILGRVSRRNTASPAKILIWRAEDSQSDRRKVVILDRKFNILRKIQTGEDLDTTAFEENSQGDTSADDESGTAESSTKKGEDGVKILDDVIDDEFSSPDITDTVDDEWNDEQPQSEFDIFSANDRELNDFLDKRFGTEDRRQRGVSGDAARRGSGVYQFPTYEAFAKWMDERYVERDLEGMKLAFAEAERDYKVKYIKANKAPEHKKDWVNHLATGSVLPAGDPPITRTTPRPLPGGGTAPVPGTPPTSTSTPPTPPGAPPRPSRPPTHHRKFNITALVQLFKQFANRHPTINAKLAKTTLGRHLSPLGLIELQKNLLWDMDLAERVLGHEIGHFIDLIVEASGKGKEIGNRLRPMFDFTGQAMHKAELKKDIINLSKAWRGNFSASDKYRNSPKELMADFLSAMFNDPEMVNQTFPNLYDAWQEFKDSKPSFKSAYREIETWLQGDTMGSELIDKFGTDTELTYDILGKGDSDNKSTWWETFNHSFISLWKRAGEKEAKKVPLNKFSPARLWNKSGYKMVKNRRVGYKIEEKLDVSHIWAANLTAIWQDDFRRDVQPWLDKVDSDPRTVQKYFQSYAVSKRTLEETKAAGVWMKDNPVETREMLEKILATVSSLEAEYLSELRNASDDELYNLSAKIARKILLMSDSKIKEIASEINSLGFEIKGKLFLGAFAVRSFLLNTGGITPESAQLVLNELQRRLSPEQYSALEKAAAELRKLVFKVSKEMYDQGLINKDIWYETILPNQNTYLPYAVLDYFDGTVRGGIMQQAGSAKRIASVIAAAQLKVQSMYILLQKQRQVKLIMDSYKAGDSGKVATVTRRLQRASDLHSIRGQHLRDTTSRAILRINGSPYLVEFPDDPGKQFEKSMEIAEFYASLDWIHNVSKYSHLAQQIYTQLAPTFLFYRNPIRGLRTGALKVGGRHILKAAFNWDSITQARNYANASFSGLMSPVIRQLVEGQALMSPRAASGQVRDVSQIAGQGLAGKFLASEMRRLARNANKKPSILGDKYRQGINFSAKVFTALEAWEKIYNYKAALAKGLTQEQALMITQMSGIPRPGVGGKFSPFVEIGWPWTRVKIQGMRATYDMARDPELGKGFWARFFMYEAVPKILQMLVAKAIISGLIAWIYNKGDDPKDPVITEVYRRISPYKMALDNIIPLMLYNPRSGKYHKFWEFKSGNEIPAHYEVVSLRIPTSEEGLTYGTFLHALMVSASGESKNLGRPGANPTKNMFDWAVNSLLPQPNPIAMTAWKTVQMLAGTNPTDDFRNQPSANKQLFDAGGKDRFQAILGFEASQTAAFGEIAGIIAANYGLIDPKALSALSKRSDSDNKSFVDKYPFVKAAFSFDNYNGYRQEENEKLDDAKYHDRAKNLMPTEEREMYNFYYRNQDKKNLAPQDQVMFDIAKEWNRDIWGLKSTEDKLKPNSKKLPKSTYYPQILTAVKNEASPKMLQTLQENLRQASSPYYSYFTNVKSGATIK